MWFYLWSNGQTVHLVPKVIPDEPTGWDLITTAYSSGSFTFPEFGYFNVVVVGGGGSGGNGYFEGPDIGGGGYDGYNKATGGGGGGAGGFAESKFLKEEGETINYTIGSIVTCGSMRATSGSSGGDRTGGKGGSASGGNLRNVQGATGGYGEYKSAAANREVSASGGSGGKNEHSYGGSGGSASNGYSGRGSSGSAPCVKIYRGNTNLSLTAQNAEDITTLMLDNAELGQEVTGIMLSQA